MSRSSCVRAVLAEWWSISPWRAAVSVRPSFVCVKYMPFPFPFCFVCRLRLLYNRRRGVFCRKLRLPFSDFGYLQLFTTARFCAILPMEANRFRREGEAAYDRLCRHPPCGRRAGYKLLHPQAPRKPRGRRHRPGRGFAGHQERAVRAGGVAAPDSAHARAHRPHPCARGPAHAEHHRLHPQGRRPYARRARPVHLDGAARPASDAAGGVPVRAGRQVQG